MRGVEIEEGGKKEVITPLTQIGTYIRIVDSITSKLREEKTKRFYSKRNKLSMQNKDEDLGRSKLTRTKKDRQLQHAHNTHNAHTHYITLQHTQHIKRQLRGAVPVP